MKASCSSPLSKRVGLSESAGVSCVSWNSAQGWIACGGSNNLIKVLKIDGNDGGKGGLEMNQTLDVPNKANSASRVTSVSWNTVHRKLATGDDQGQVIIWLLNNNVWTVEMVSNREGKAVVDLKWSPDGEKIFITHSDGMVIVGGVNGSRIWYKQLNFTPRMVEWFPDSRLVYMATDTGSVEVYDACPVGDAAKADSTKLYTLTDHCHTPEEAKAAGKNLQVATVQVADPHRVTDPAQAMVAVAYTDGRIQLMTSTQDAQPVLVDTQLKLKPGACLRWAPDGFALAVAGQTANGDWQLRFISPQGHNLRNLKLPNGPVEGLDWEGQGQRVALATPQALLLCDVRRRRHLAYADRTLVSAYQRRDRDGAGSEFAVTFWDTATNERCSKIISSLSHLRAAEDLTLLASHVPDAAEGPYVVLVLTGLGAGSITMSLPCEPKHLDASSTHMLVADDSTVCILNYAAPRNPSGLQIARAYTQPRDEVVFNVVHDPSARNATTRARYVRPPMSGAGVLDKISAVCVGANTALVACESGLIYRYSLPKFSFIDKISTKVLPAQISLNSDCSALAVIDFDGILSLWGQVVAPQTEEGGKGKSSASSQALLRAIESSFNPGAAQESSAVLSAPGLMTELEALSSYPDLSTKFDGPKRSDVWQVLWAKDSPNMIAVMEKSRLSVLRNGLPEEPLTSSAVLLDFKDLKIIAAHPEQLCSRPPVGPAAAGHSVERTLRESLREMETKSLRDLKAMLRNLPNLVDATVFVEDLDHPRLWALLGEAALERLDLAAAERAFARVEDYRGLQFTRRLRQIDDRAKQAAEVSAFFGAFVDAEKSFLELNRADLAIDLRKRLGDWVRVLELVKHESKGGSVGVMLSEVAGESQDGLQGGVAVSAALREAHKHVAEYYIDRAKFQLAIEHLRAAGDWPGLVEAYFATEQFEELYKLGQSLPKGSSLCSVVGQRLAAAGLCKWAVEIHLRGPSSTGVKAAIDTCVQLSEWALAVQIAEENGAPTQTTETLLDRYAQTLDQRGQTLQAVQLCQKAGRHLQSASLLRQLASDFSATGRLSASPADLEAAEDARQLAEKSLEGLASYSAPLLRAPHTLKKIHLLAAIEAQTFREKLVEQDEQRRQQEMAAEQNKGDDGDESVFEDQAKKTIRLAAQTGNVTTLGGGFKRGGAAGMSLAGGGPRSAAKDRVATMLAAESATMTTGATQVGATKLGGGVGGGGSDSFWRGAEAMHLYLLVHANLYRGAEDDALRAAKRLAEYEDVVPPRISYPLLALCAIRVRLWGEASRAFARLEASSKDIPVALSRAFSDLAVQLFTRFPPENPEPSDDRPSVPCPSCSHPLRDWDNFCSQCDHQLPFCVLSGRSIFTPGLSKMHLSKHALQSEEAKRVEVQIRSHSVSHPQQSDVMRCTVCRHFTFKMHAMTRKTCALCHSPVAKMID